MIIPEEIISYLYFLTSGDTISLEECNEILMCSPRIERVRDVFLGLDFENFPTINFVEYDKYYGRGNFEKNMLLLHFSELKIEESISFSQ